MFTMENSFFPRIGNQMNELTILENAYIAVAQGKIFQVGVGDEYKKLIGENTKVDDVGGKLVTPGLIDSHTHLVHGGSRENEFSKKLNGVPYIQILQEGGGILSTVNATKEATFDELYNKAKKSLDRMVEFGVTTVESKSGYGLDLETEIKQLEVAHKLNEDHPIDWIIGKGNYA